MPKKRIAGMLRPSIPTRRRSRVYLVLNGIQKFTVKQRKPRRVYITVLGGYNINDIHEVSISNPAVSLVLLFYFFLFVLLVSLVFVYCDEHDRLKNLFILFLLLPLETRVFCFTLVHLYTGMGKILILQSIATQDT